MQQTLKTVELSQYLSAADELIEEARNGRMFILVDDEDRENEGDRRAGAICHAGRGQFHGALHAGLIFGMTRQRVEQLGLPLMSAHNGTGIKPPSPSRSRRAKASPPASPATTARAPLPWRSTPSAAATTS
jgi:3,4-dihydroxy-2-butanone 4-phosphate synthase